MQRLTYYSDSGFWAVMVRGGFLLVIGAVIFASVAPVGWVPRLLFSRHLEHFAAFYVAALMAAAAMPRARLMRIGAALTLFAAALELMRMIPSQHRIWEVADWQADFGGILAALAPIVAEKFRASFDPRDGR